MSIVTSPKLDSNVSELSGKLTLGKGAQFWAYVSPQNNTAAVITKWVVTLQHMGSNWTGQITSDNPTANLQTPGLSGIFHVTVQASGPKFDTTVLAPMSDSQPNIGCNSNCAAMVGIVANGTGNGGNYWTVWDAFCKS